MLRPNGRRIDPFYVFATLAAVFALGGIVLTTWPGSRLDTTLRVVTGVAALAGASLVGVWIVLDILNSRDLFSQRGR